MAKIKLWLFIAATIALSGQLHLVQAATSSAHLPLEARDDTSSQEEDLISTSYVLPNQIFNDGKPYYADKDPISGQFDFSAKKPAGIEPAANEVIDPKEKIVLSNSSPNIHDYLNLPVKYSSSKFVYPLVSSSYANLKYQGSNKNYVTNKKPTSVAVPATIAPNYHSHYYNVPTTKLMAVPPTAAGIFTSSSASTSTTTTTTSKKPTTTTTTTTTATRPTTSTTVTTSAATSTTPTGSSSKYTTSTRRPLPISTTSPPRPTTTASTTRKKFIPTRKYSPTTTVTTSSTPMRFPDAFNTTAAPRPTTTTIFTTHHPTRPASIFPTNPAPSTTKFVPSTTQQVVFTEDPTRAPAFSPMPGSTRVPNLDAADVYQTLDQKNTAQKIEQKPSMSLADIFNSLAEEESALASNNQGNQGFDAQGNLMQPFAPSKPSPFAMQGPYSTRPTFVTTAGPNGQQQQYPPQQHPSQQPQYPHDQKVISNSQENFSNEYVSYQVQQPNVMSYRPAPGAINNVVISPGQHSASFVLGSQQQVGTNSFGSVEKEPLFAKEPPVQYGTVISEDIGPVKRPSPSPPHQQQATSNYPPSPPTSYQQMPAHVNSNFHQNGNFPHGSNDAVQRPLTPPASTGGYQEEPPAAPSPYQQLPLMNSNAKSRPQPPKQQQQQQEQHPQQQQQQQQHQQQLTHPNGQQNGTPEGHQVPAQNNYQHGPPSALAPPQQTNYPQQQQPQQQRPEEPIPEDSNNRPFHTLPNAQDTKELLVSTNIRFPANEDQSDELPAGPFAAGPPAGPQVNGHAQPLSLQQIQNSNPVVFPKAKDEDIPSGTQLNEVLYQGEPHLDDIQIQQHEVVNLSQQKQKLNFPQQQVDPNTPSQHMEPPPRFPPTLTSSGGEHGGELHKRPQPNRPHGPPPYNAYNEYTRKPIPGIANRPNPDRNLPNILPQFRPNAKVSSGHPPQSPNYNQEPGNIRISGHPPKRLNQSPQFAHRRQPLMQQKRYPMNRIAEYPAGPPPPGGDANRRVYRLPPYGGQGVQYVDRMYGRRPMPQGVRPADSYAAERHSSLVNPENYQTLPQQQQQSMSADRMAAFEEEDLVINDPPQPVTANKDRKSIDETKLEPVVTLQMLQSQKKPVSLTNANDDTGSGEIQVPAGPDNSDSPQSNYENQNSQNGLYVVYPMKGGNQDSNIAAESQDPLPAIAHIEPPTGSEYQNTPFSVVRDQPQEPILMVKNNKKPQSLQQQNKSQPPKDKFPYPIEKPDPSFSDLNPHKRVPGMLIAPRIINGAYGTEAPIAIAYTPTEPNPYRRTGPTNAQNAQKYSNVNLATSVISEIRTDTQTEEGLSNNDFDVRGQNFEKDFMAPFYPSVSLGTATNTPSNGWNILPSSTDNSIYEKNMINRADVGEPNVDTDGQETTTKSFELDSFQPELQGGFKPIYPPGYKLEEEGTEHMPAHESNDMPYALASRMEPPSRNSAESGVTSSSSTSTTTTSTSTSSTTTTTTTTPRPQVTSTTKANAEEKVSTSTTSKSKSATTSVPASSTTTGAPKATPTPTLRKKSTFETSLEALLFGDDEDFEDETEARKDQSKANSGPRSVPRMGPRNLKLKS